MTSWRLFFDSDPRHPHLGAAFLQFSSSGGMQLRKQLTLSLQAGDCKVEVMGVLFRICGSSIGYSENCNRIY
jgi:hypothetical protein